MAKKNYSGFTDKTAQNLLLDSGAFFKNFEVGTDTFQEAVTSGKLLGATRGGGTFTAKPEIRQIEIDGVKGAAKGLEVIDSWEVTIQANLLEVTAEVLKMALASATIKPGAADSKYDEIRANNEIQLGDYIDNITWVGNLSGSAEPVIIQVYNAINTEGISLNPTSKGEAVTAVTFKGHYDAAELEVPPFAIFYPKAKPAAAETKKK